MVDADIEGDTFFPDYAHSEWREIEREHLPADAQNAYPMDFIRLVAEGSET